MGRAGDEINLTLSKINTAISEANAATEGAKTQTEATQKAVQAANTRHNGWRTWTSGRRRGNTAAEARRRWPTAGGKLVLTLGIERGKPGAKGTRATKATGETKATRGRRA